jgi:DNA-directed RNA polymerase specialized sigma24 family protein
MEEIARMHGIPVSTAYKRRARALAALKAAAAEMQATDDR